jgi:hypothetical protein
MGSTSPTRSPSDGGVVALCRDEVAPLAGGGGERVVGEFRVGEDRLGVVEQFRDGAQQPGLGLPARPEEDQVVLREEGVDDAGDDGAVVPDDAGEDRPALREAGAEVGAHLVADAASGVLGPGGGAERAEGGRAGGVGGVHGESLAAPSE